MSLIKAGACIFLPDRGRRDEYHLHVVLNDPYGDPPTVAVVSWSSTINEDKTVILRVGEHSFIDKETYVVYEWMQYKNARILETQIAADLTKKYRHNCSPALLKRIQDGIFISKYTRPKAYEYCRIALGRDDIQPKRQVVPATPRRVQ